MSICFSAVYIKFRSDDAYRVARYSDATFDVVLALVCRTGCHRIVAVEPFASLLFAECRLVLTQDVVICYRLIFEQHRVARREIEHHHVVALDVFQTFQTVVTPFDFFGEGFFCRRERHRVVYERYGERGLRHLRSRM